MKTVPIRITIHGMIEYFARYEEHTGRTILDDVDKSKKVKVDGTPNTTNKVTATRQSLINSGHTKEVAEVDKIHLSTFCERSKEWLLEILTDRKNECSKDETTRELFNKYWSDYIRDYESEADVPANAI